MRQDAFSRLFKGLRGVLIAVAAAVICAGPVVADAGLSRERARMNQRVFDRVWSEVRRDYYDPHLHGVDWEAARETYRPRALAAGDDRTLYRELGEMLDLLDDAHAGAQPPASVRREAQRRVRRAVMGLVLARETDEVWRVDGVRAGSPAEEAGVRIGWKLTGIDGTPWGPEVEVHDGVPVQADLLDEAGTAHRLEITPREMDGPPAFVADRSRPGVLVLSIDGFEPGLGRWLGHELAGLPPSVDVVLDLRGNPGGRLREADAVLSCFLPRAQPWATRRGRSGRAVELRVDERCGDLPGPVDNDLAVLVDQASRSAAELTPAALQEAGRAIVVGERTVGAVLIAQDTRLPDGGRLTLSRADFITRGGVRLEKAGVTPDIVVSRTIEDRQTGRDPMLDAAVAALGADGVEQAHGVGPAGF